LLSHIVAAAAGFMILAGTASAAEGPPDPLIRENCRKAEAIVKGVIVSSETKPNDFTRTKFRVSGVFRGPFHPGDELTYFSFRESAERSARELEQNLIVFLVGWTAAGPRQWGTAIDFSEFSASPQLESKVRNCVGRKRR
jgi:hypothetical protein